MPLTTRCRHCGRLFPIYAQQLKQRGGKVDCPQCGRRFAGVNGLIDEPMPGEEIQRDGRGTGGRGEPAATAPADMLDLAAGRRKKRRARTLLWSGGSLLLAAGLILQMAWWDRGTWLQRPQLRAAAADACKRLGCKLELPRLAGTMDIIQPALTEQPNDHRELRLTLLLRNRASVAQRFPVLQLELYAEGGELTAARRFQPRQYMPPQAGQLGIAPGGTARVALDLATPQSAPASFRVKLF
jgi:predicted Zn finger-like uncharacterized protein